MRFRHDLRARIKFATFGKHASHRIKRIQTLSFPQEVNEINNRTIEVTFNEINVTAVRRFVHRQFRAGECIRALKLVMPSTDDLQRTRVGKIEAVPQFNDRANDKWRGDAPARLRRMLLQELRPFMRARGYSPRNMHLPRANRSDSC